ncbi:MAG: hypothetical protein ACYCW6_15005 [Candidatus Xenobia bacterium]
MARLHRKHSLDGLSGNVGKHLHLHDKGDGRLEVRILDCPSSVLADMHWEQFKEAVAYARDSILIHADDNVMVTQVGVIITDADNHLIEMGMALASGSSWRYLATRPAQTHHVRVIVDAADLPGHITESRLEKDL